MPSIFISLVCVEKIRVSGDEASHMLHPSTGLNLPYLSYIYYQFNLLFPDHKELFQDLHEVAPKWQNFGVHLKVPFSRIQGIAGGDGTVDRCFTTMLDTWLQGETAPSVDRLVSALQMPGVDQRVLALDIDKNKQSEHMSSYDWVVLNV